MHDAEQLAFAKRHRHKGGNGDGCGEVGLDVGTRVGACVGATIVGDNDGAIVDGATVLGFKKRRIERRSIFEEIALETS